MPVTHSQDFVNDAVELIIAEAHKAFAERGWFSLSLCGGGTPKPIYRALGEVGKLLPWDKIVITFGDERVVPPSHADSNYRMVKEALLDHVAIPPENVLRLKGELPPEEAAANAELVLDTLALRMGTDTFTHDLVLLGLGGDGHTASLFPRTAALEITDRRVVGNYVEKLDAHRLTFTYPFINSARRIVFLINDATKDAVVQEVISRKGDHPANGIKPMDGELTFLLGY